MHDIILRNDESLMIFSTRGSSNRISRRNSTKKNRDSNSSNRLSGMSFDGEIIPEGTNLKIVPAFGQMSLGKFRVNTWVARVWVFDWWKDRDVPIPPKRSNSSVSDLPTIPGEGPFEEIVNIPKKSYSVVNLSQPEKRKAATLPRKSSQAKVRFPYQGYPDNFLAKIG